MNLQPLQASQVQVETLTSQGCEIHPDRSVGESLKENDDFILDAGLDLFLWVGQNANKQERAKSAYAVTSIRNNERTLSQPSITLGTTPRMRKLFGRCWAASRRR